MSYRLEDVIRLKLPVSLASEFLKELSSTFYPLETSKIPDNGDLTNIYSHISSIVRSKIVLEDYRSTAEYLLVEDPVKRAKIAMRAQIKDHADQIILSIWLKYADQMTQFEKAMAGWDKFE